MNDIIYKPSFIKVQLLSSCCCACKKYRPSVHNAALVWVTIAVPMVRLVHARYRNKSNVGDQFR